MRPRAKYTILLGCAVCPALAQPPQDEWNFTAILYGYWATLSGSATFPMGTTANIIVDPTSSSTA